MLTNRLLDTKFKVVHGYPGAAEVDLAVENGEVQGEAGKDWTTLTSTRPQWIKDRKINILVQMGMGPHADLKDVPMAIELAKTGGGPHVMEVVFAKFGMSRPFFARQAWRRNGLRRCAARSMRRCGMTHSLPTRNSWAWRSIRSVARMSRRWSLGS